MTEDLKTLEDIEEDLKVEQEIEIAPDFLLEFEGKKPITAERLRQEAIKHLKSYREFIENEEEKFDLEQRSIDIVQAKGIVFFIKEFFDISEEDIE